MEFILDLIYIYVAIFSIYYFILAIRSLNERKFELNRKYTTNVEQSKICVVVYAHNNYEALKNMLKQLANQTYNVQNFIITVILDNCNDHSEELIQENSNVRLLNLNDGVNVGKDQAIPIFLESQRNNNAINNYVFLDIERFVEANFLEEVNKALYISPCITGQTIVIENNNLTCSEKIKTIYTKYINKFVRKSRALFGFADNIDVNFFAINKEFIDKVDAIDFKNINTELKYSILLSTLGYPCTFVPSIKTYVRAYNYKLIRPSLSYRIKLFRQCFCKLFSLNYHFIEHTFSLIAPSGLVIGLLSLFYLYLSYKYYFVFNFMVVFTIFSLLLFGYAISIIKAELFAKDFMYLIAYPFYSIGHILDNLPPYRFIKKYFLNSNKNSKNLQKYTVKVIATNGKANIPCKLDLISENGMAKVVFTFKKKKFTSSNQIRMVEALNELTGKLKDYGFQLKICYCCEYFSSIVDGSQNMVKGTCGFMFKGRNMNDELDTLIWNSCPACKPKKDMSLIADLQNEQK